MMKDKQTGTIDDAGNDDFFLYHNIWSSSILIQVEQKINALTSQSLHILPLVVTRHL